MGLVAAAGSCAPVRDIMVLDLEVNVDTVINGYECYEMVVNGSDDIRYRPR